MLRTVDRVANKRIRGGRCKSYQHVVGRMSGSGTWTVEDNGDLANRKRPSSRCGGFDESLTAVRQRKALPQLGFLDDVVSIKENGIAAGRGLVYTSAVQTFCAKQFIILPIQKSV